MIVKINNAHMTSDLRFEPHDLLLPDGTNEFRNKFESDGSPFPLGRERQVLRYVRESSKNVFTVLPAPEG